MAVEEGGGALKVESFHTIMILDNKMQQVGATLVFGNPEKRPAKTPEMGLWRGFCYEVSSNVIK